MSKRKVKTIISNHDDLRAVNDFLNEKKTGEIYEMKTNLNSDNRRIFYTFLFEELEEDEMKSFVQKNQRRISEIKTTDTKPKLI